MSHKSILTELSDRVVSNCHFYGIDEAVDLQYYFHKPGEPTDAQESDSDDQNPDTGSSRNRFGPITGSRGKF